MEVFEIADQAALWDKKLEKEIEFLGITIKGFPAIFQILTCVFNIINRNLKDAIIKEYFS